MMGTDQTPPRPPLPHKRRGGECRHAIARGQCATCLRESLEQIRALAKDVLEGHIPGSTSKFRKIYDIATVEVL